MNLEELGKFLGATEPFHPMTKLEWESFGGANPGTYMSLDAVGFRVLFAEPSGDVGILYGGPNWELSDEIGFNVDDGLEGFSDEAVEKNAAYWAETAQLRNE